jgi:hypothetical protein
MPRGRKPKERQVSLLEQWKSGEYNPLKPGSVCRYKNNPESKDRVVVASQAFEIGTYFSRIWHGPKPWDYIDAEVHYADLEVVDEENPTKYTASDRYPGPSSDMIKELNRKFAEKRKRDAEISQEERERHIAALEEELGKKRIISDESTSDSDSDDSYDEGIGVDPLEKKRMEMINEE